MMRIESSWSVLPQAPNIIVPRQSCETWTPLRPRGRYSMGSPSRGSGGCGRPAGQQVERLLGRRPGLGGVDGDRRSAVGGRLHDLVGELELAHDRVVQPLGA